MMIMSSIIVITSVVLTCLIIRETPIFFFKKGRLLDLVNNLTKLAKFNGSGASYIRHDIYDLIFENTKITKFLINCKAKIEFPPIKNSSESLQKSSFLATLFRPIYIYRIFVVSIISCWIMLVNIGLLTELGNFGIDNIGVAGIILGITTCIGNIIILPFIHKIPRVRGSLIAEILQVIFVIIISIISYLPKNRWSDYAQGLITMVPLSILTSFSYVFFSIQTIELFPT